MQSKAATVAEYLAALPADRREALSAVRKVILANLDPDYQETMQYGMIGYSVPHTVFPDGYHCDPKQPLPFAGLASQKGHMSLYMMCLYNSPAQMQWFQAAWAKTGKKLDMGKACIRFKKLEDVPLEVVGEAVRRVPAKAFIAAYQALLGMTQGAKARKPATRRSGSPSGAAAKTAKAAKVTRKSQSVAKPAAQAKKKAKTSTRAPSARASSGSRAGR